MTKLQKSCDEDSDQSYPQIVKGNVSSLIPQQPDLIDTTDQRGDSMQLLKRSSSTQLGTSLAKQYEIDYDDEEFNMNEQSEEGTAEDYDIQTEVVNDIQQQQQQLSTSMGFPLPQQQSATSAKQHNKPSGSFQQAQQFGQVAQISAINNQRPSMQEFDEELFSG